MQSDLELIVDVVYGKGGRRPLKMSILHKKILPKKPMPVICYVHGGGWQGGNEILNIPQLIDYAKDGYFCVSVEYRLSQEAIFPAQIHDCKCAIRFLKAHAKRFHINPDKIGAWGFSAGGHLVALLGTSGHVKELEGNGGWQNYSSSVFAVCDCSGPTDIRKAAREKGFWWINKPDTAYSKLIGGPACKNKEKAKQVSPITYVTKDAAEFLIMHGYKDNCVPVNQAVLLYDALKKAGVKSTLYIEKGGGHVFDSIKTYKMVKNFFDKHLK